MRVRITAKLPALLWAAYRDDGRDAKHLFVDRSCMLLVCGVHPVTLAAAEAKPLLDYLTTICDRSVVDWEILR